jgi:chaperonin cofactor prefoldin
MLSTEQLLYLAQGLVERSRQKTDLLKGYGDTILHIEALEKKLEKSKKHFALLQSKLHGPFAQYHNKV